MLFFAPRRLLFLALLVGVNGVIDDWKKVTRIYGENQNDFSGSAIRLNAQGDSIAIHSYNQGSIVHGKTALYSKSDHNATILDEKVLAQWPEDHRLEYKIRSLRARVRLAYAGDGSRLAVGLHFNLTIYDLNADKGTWTYIGAPSGFDQFSQTIMDIDLSSNGDFFAISSYSFGVGQTDIFKLGNESQWDLVGSSIAAGTSNTSIDAVSLAGNGQRVATSERFIGSSGENGGIAKVYEFDETSLDWQQMGDDIAIVSSGDFAGKSLALSRDGLTVAVGAPYSDVVIDNITKQSIGSVHTYRFDELVKEWIPLGVLTGDRPLMSFGNAIDLSKDGNIVAVGNSDSLKRYQKVQIFEYVEVNSTWNQLGQDIKSDGSLKSYFGITLSLSDDGKSLAIGSPGASRKGDADSSYVMSNAGMTEIYKYVGPEDEETISSEDLIFVNSRNMSRANDKVGAHIGSVLLMASMSIIMWFSF